MARYKVPQDVEAEDKLLGPFTFRQFIYLIIGAACVAAAWGLAQIFLLLAIIPVPIAIFFFVLALPLKKDQPMETYLAAVISFYIKPNKRLWASGQRESTILITAPKKKEKSRTRDITEDEASHRLSFLANLVDTEGASIRGGNSSIKAEYVAEANQVNDIMDTPNANIDRIIAEEQSQRHATLVNQMRNAIDLAESVNNPTQASSGPVLAPPADRAAELRNLANNNAFSVQTIANQANRLAPPTSPPPGSYSSFNNQAIFSPKEGN